LSRQVRLAHVAVSPAPSRSTGFKTGVQSTQSIAGFTNNPNWWLMFTQVQNLSLITGHGVYGTSNM
jgi:hypothetical protein